MALALALKPLDWTTGALTTLGVKLECLVKLVQGQIEDMMDFLETLTYMCVVAIYMLVITRHYRLKHRKVAVNISNMIDQNRI